MEKYYSEFQALAEKLLTSKRDKHQKYAEFLPASELAVPYFARASVCTAERRTGLLTPETRGLLWTTG